MLGRKTGGSFRDANDGAQGIGDEDGSERSSADDDQLGGLHQDFQVPVLHQVAANNGAEAHYDSNNGEHLDLAAPVGQGVHTELSV
jgi:hypothetical protein